MGVQFVLDGQRVSVDDVAPHVTLLQWLRASGKTGTKEGCAEGECGACAVAIPTHDAHGRAVFESINSCLVPLASLAGRTVITSEGIAPPGTPLHPVQTAMVKEGGSQCGYCTPGFVVSLFCEYYRPERSLYDPESISGNLCRCTGYRPIVAAAQSLPLPSALDPWLDVARESAAQSVAERPPPGQGSERFLRPTSLREAFETLSEFPGATLIAGGTDLMVAANQRFQRWSTLMALDSIAELRRVESTSRELTIGAAVTLSRLAEQLEGEGAQKNDSLPGVPIFSQLLPLFSSRLIRNRATLGGNLATASPIGDSAPALMALDAEITLASASSTRRIALHDFFLGYRQTALERGEIIAQIHLPLPLPRRQRFYKVSKRVMDDISTVSAAFTLSLDDAGRVQRIRAAFGGVAATPVRAMAVESQALGKPWSADMLAVLLPELKEVGTPQSDHRGSADYRRAMIGKLFERFLAETCVNSDAVSAAVDP